VCLEKNARVYLYTNENDLVERGKLIDYARENIIIERALRGRRVRIHSISSREVSF